VEVPFEGEFPPISERLLIAPARGRLHHHRVREGRALQQGTVIGELRTIGGRVQVRSRLAGTFLAWIAAEGESVKPGQAVAIVRPAEDEPPPGSFVGRT
jgi:multidrug efflux pump subunit AcrA (membrane-fusion protein)